jgi:predicted dehydrogenase
MDARQGAPGEDTSGTAASPGVGVGFVGAGNVLAAYLQLLDRLVPRGLAWEGPVFARDRATWDDLRRRRPHIQLVDSVDEVWGSDVAVVVVITPPATHAEYAMSALRHGKHVVCEKPVGMHRGEAAPIFAHAADAGLHVVAAPFVHLSPTFRELWTRVRRGDLGQVHSARALYGNAGVTWSGWYHDGGVGPVAELGVYNLKSLTALLGPAREVYAAGSVAVPERTVAGRRIAQPDPDVAHLVVRHADGALSSVVASQAIQRYHRPAIELYGTDGTANLLGDDWDPRGLQIWTNVDASWRRFDPADATWLWTDGLRDLIQAVSAGRRPLADADHDLHLLDVIDAARRSAATGAPVAVDSSFRGLDLTVELDVHGHLHDHTRPAEDQ